MNQGCTTYEILGSVDWETKRPRFVLIGNPCE